MCSSVHRIQKAGETARILGNVRRAASKRTTCIPCIWEELPQNEKENDVCWQLKAPDRKNHTNRRATAGKLAPPDSAAGVLGRWPLERDPHALLLCCTLSTTHTSASMNGSVIVSAYPSTIAHQTCRTQNPTHSRHTGLSSTPRFMQSGHDHVSKTESEFSSDMAITK